MAYPVVRIAVTEPVRALSTSLWRNALEAFGDGISTVGHARLDDMFNKYNVTDATADSGWKIQDAAAGGTSENFTSIAGADGLADLTAATGTAHFGIEAWRPGASINLATHSTDPRGDVVFEARLEIDKAQAQYVGLSEDIAEFISSTTTLPTASDYIGFFRNDAGDLTFVCANDNAGGTAVTDSVTVVEAADLVDNTIYKLGFRVNSDSTVELSFDGDPVKYDTSGALITIDPLALPIESLTPKIFLGRDDGAEATVGAQIDYVADFVGE